MKQFWERLKVCFHVLTYRNFYFAAYKSDEKVQKIHEEVERIRNLHQMKYQQLDTDDKMCLVECGKRNLCNDLLYFIDSLQEEPVSEDLEEAAKNHAAERFRVTRDRELAEKCKWSFKAGANWKRDQIAKENMLLPFKEYDNLMESINKRKKEGYETGYKQGLVDSKSEQKPTLDELPFGAKDSELIEKTISIPKGCYVIIKDNKIIIRKEKFI